MENTNNIGNTAEINGTANVTADAENGTSLDDAVHGRSRDKRSAPLLCSVRLLLFIMLMTATSIMVVQRFNINFGVVCMHRPIELSLPAIEDAQLNPASVNLPQNSTENRLGSRSCPTFTKKLEESTKRSEGIHRIPTRFTWSKEVQGSIIAASYYGLAVSQLPSAWIVDNFGAKRSLFLSLFSLSVLSTLNPFAAMCGPSYMFIVRFLQGVVNGPALPAINVLGARWCGSMERSFLLGLTAAGFPIAAGTVYPISAFLCDNLGWDWVFYFAAAIGFIWCVCALPFVHEWPEEHPFIPKRELQFLQDNRAVHYGGIEPEIANKKTPWKSMLLSAPIWAYLVGNFTCFWCFISVGGYLPLYLNEVLQLTIFNNGVFSALPFAGMLFFQLFVASLFDKFRALELCSLTNLRKAFNTFGTFPAAFTMVMVGFLPCDSAIANVVTLTMSQGFLEFAMMGGFYLSIFDMAPQFTSILTALGNLSSYLAGFISAAVVSWITVDGSGDQWLQVFYLTAAINVTGGLVYFFFGSSDLQPWANEAEKKEANKSMNTRNEGATLA